jgi:hypothetical protein
LSVVGVQLSVVTEKLNVVTDGGRRKLGSQLGVVTEKLGVVRKFNVVTTGVPPL